MDGLYLTTAYIVFLYFTLKALALGSVAATFVAGVLITFLFVLFITAFAVICDALHRE